VFQAYNLIPVLTARENVEFVMQLQGVTAQERTNKAMEILKEVQQKMEEIEQSLSLGSVERSKEIKKEGHFPYFHEIGENTGSVPPFPINGYTIPFNFGAALNDTLLLALILIGSPVLGFLPALALRFRTEKVPNPG